MEYRRKPFSKMLIDLRSLQGQIGVMDRINIGIRTVQQSRRNNKLAILDQREQLISTRFFVDYLSHRGTQVRLVNNITDATKWLLE